MLINPGTARPRCNPVRGVPPTSPILDAAKLFLGVQVLLKQALQNYGWNKGGSLLAHLVPFAGDGGYHKGIPYNYTSPSVIKAKFDTLQWAGVDGVIITWQGSSKPINQEATLEIANECGRRGMSFALLADPAVYSTWKARGFGSAESCVIAELTNAEGGALLNSTQYLPEKYFLQFDNAGFNPATVVAAVPSIKILPIHSGFSWINSKDTYANVIADIKAQHSSTSMVIPSVWYAFNDGGSVNAAFPGVNRMDANGLDMNVQSWSGDTAQSRALFPRSGNTFYDVLATVPLASKYLALGTWDDPNEGSDFETMCSIFCGQRIA